MDRDEKTERCRNFIGRKGITIEKHKDQVYVRNNTEHGIFIHNEKWNPKVRKLKQGETALIFSDVDYAMRLQEEVANSGQAGNSGQTDSRPELSVSRDFGSLSLKNHFEN